MGWDLRFLLERGSHYPAVQRLRRAAVVNKRAQGFILTILGKATELCHLQGRKIQVSMWKHCGPYYLEQTLRWKKNVTSTQWQWQSNNAEITDKDCCSPGACTVSVDLHTLHPQNSSSSDPCLDFFCFFSDSCPQCGKRIGAHCDPARSGLQANTLWKYSYLWRRMQTYVSARQW